MAIIPRKTASRDLNIGRGARIINTDAGVGSAIANIGGEISSMGSHIQKRREQKEDFNAVNEYQLLQLQHQSAMDDAKENIEGDGEGFHETFIGDDYRKRNSDFINSLPNRLKEKYMLRSQTDDERWKINSARIERDQGYEHDRFEIGNRGEEIRNNIFSNDGQYQEGVMKGIELINASSLPALEKKKLASELRMASICSPHTRG